MLTKRYDKKIAVIGGQGYVGKAIVKFFEDHYRVIVYDPNAKFSISKKDINECDAAFVCVPTPRNKDGSCDVSLVEDIVQWLETEIIVIKSTVSIGTTKMLSEKYGKDLVFSPEYLGESTYWTPFDFHQDLKQSPFYTFGGTDEACSKVIDLFLVVSGPVKRYNIEDSTVVEMAKYMENAFYATKIAFCNEIYDICNVIGVDWNKAREIWLSDPRIHKMHTAVFKDNRGFEGKCLPKDTSALIATAEENGCNVELLKGVMRSNDIIRKIQEEKYNKLSELEIQDD